MGDEAEAFLEPLCKLFNDKAWPVQVAAVKTISRSGETGQMYAADVCRLIFNGSVQTRVAALEALLVGASLVGVSAPQRKVRS